MTTSACCEAPQGCAEPLHEAPEGDGARLHPRDTAALPLLEGRAMMGRIKSGAGKVVSVRFVRAIGGESWVAVLRVDWITGLHLVGTWDNQVKLFHQLSPAVDTVRRRWQFMGAITIAEEDLLY